MTDVAAASRPCPASIFVQFDRLQLSKQFRSRGLFQQAEPKKVAPKPMKMAKPGAPAAGESIGGAKVMKKPARRCSVLPGGLSTAAPAPATDATTSYADCTGSYTGGAAPATSPKPVKTMKKPERRSSVLAVSAQGGLMGNTDGKNGLMGSTDGGTKVMKKPCVTHTRLQRSGAQSRGIALAVQICAP